MVTKKMLGILEDVVEGVRVAIISGDYKKANEFLDILEAAKGLRKEETNPDKTVKTNGG